MKIKHLNKMKIYLGSFGFKYTAPGKAVRWNFDLLKGKLTYCLLSENWKKRTTKKFKTVEEVKKFLDSKLI